MRFGQPQPYIINITNTSTSDISSVGLFNANVVSNLPPSDNFGNDPNISISTGFGNVTYSQLLSQSQTRPFTVGLTYIQSSNSSQVLQTIALVTTDANGNSTSKSLIPTFDPYQSLNSVIPITMQYTIDGSKQLLISTMLAGATLVLQLYPIDQINLSRGLNGQNALSNFGSPNISFSKEVYF